MIATFHAAATEIRFIRRHYCGWLVRMRPLKWRNLLPKLFILIILSSLCDLFSYIVLLHCNISANLKCDVIFEVFELEFCVIKIFPLSS